MKIHGNALNDIKISTATTTTTKQHHLRFYIFILCVDWKIPRRYLELMNSLSFYPTNCAQVLQTRSNTRSRYFGRFSGAIVQDKFNCQFLWFMH